MTMLALPLLAAAGVPACVAVDVKPGVVLDQSTADDAKNLLPPEIYNHYKKGEYTNRVVDFPDSKFQWDDGYQAASEWNREHVTLGASKQPVDKATGKRPEYLKGRPFPDIREDDPDAAVKILWNTTYEVYQGGNSRNLTALDWVSPTGRDRSAIQDVTFLYYDGQPRQYIPAANPENLLFQFIALTVTPADLQGTAALSWRYHDPDKRDASWAYVPALRRVRQVSPANRSDGFLGSDLSQDDGAIFDGKPEDFEWKLVGERDTLALADPASLAGSVKRTVRPDGGFEDDWPVDQKVAGYQDPNWTGLAWAPLAPVLVQRKVWIIEATPRDPYYLF